MARALHPAHRGRRDLAGQQRILGIILKVSPAEGIAVDVHAGAEMDVDAVMRHLLAQLFVQRLHKLCIPGAGQGRPDGHEGRKLLEPEPRGAVGGDKLRHALFAQALDHAAEAARVAGGARGDIHHPLAPCEGFKLLRTERRDIAVKGNFSRLNVVERPALGCGGGCLRQLREDHLAQLIARQPQGAAGLHGLLRGKAEASDFTLADQEAVLPVFKDKGVARFVEGGELLIRTPKRDDVALAGVELAGLGEGAQHALRFFQSSHGCRAPELHDLLAGHGAGVRNARGDGQLSVEMGKVLTHGFKARIAQAEAEGKEHTLLPVSLKMPVADENPFGVVVVILAAEVFAAGIVHMVAGNGIAESAAGTAHAAEDIRRGVAALHAALPGDQHGGQAVAVILGPGHVHDAADIHQHHHPGKSPRHHVEYVALFLREVVAALLQPVLPILARGAADDHEGGFCGFGCLPNLMLRKLHLRVIKRPVTPPAGIRRIIRAPGGIAVGKRLV